MSIYQANVNVLLTADEFRHKYEDSYRQQNIKLNYPLCRSKITFVNSKSVRPHFRHGGWPPNCPWSAYHLLSYSKFSEKHGIKLKSEFCKLNNLKQVFKTTQNIHGKYMNGELFYELCKTANKYQIWNCVGLTLEYLPYILLTLHTFSDTEKNGTDTSYRYTINKPNNKSIDVIWKYPNKYKLQKRLIKKMLLWKVIMILLLHAPV